jgi:hypothetical protein
LETVRSCNNQLPNVTTSKLFHYSSKSNETFNQSNVKTKDFESSAIQFVRTREEESGANTSRALSPTNTMRFPHQNLPFQSHPFANNHSFNVSGIPLYPQNPQFHNFSQPPAPGNGQMFNVRVREYCYDYFSVTANDMSRFMQTMPNVTRAIDYVPTNQTIPLIQQNNEYCNAGMEQALETPKAVVLEASKAVTLKAPKAVVLEVSKNVALEAPKTNKNIVESPPKKSQKGKFKN